MNLKDILNFERDLFVDGRSTMDDFTVLSPQKDPYRADTPKNRAAAEWLRDACEEIGLDDDSRIHLRGLHYLFVGRVKMLDGQTYVNDAKTWEWLQDTAAFAARWLGYIDFKQFRDARNPAPQIFAPEITEPEWHVHVGDVELLLPDELEPEWRLHGHLSRQQWRIVAVAEKQGVVDVLLPILRRYHGVLCLPGGEVTTSMLYDQIAAADKNGQDLAVCQFGDFDPSGWQMGVSTARKFQAFHDLKFPHMKVQVSAIALTKEQVVEWDLPESPLKETEKRGEKWVKYMGREQTELDAAVALAPDKLAKVVDSWCANYYDRSLENRAQKRREILEKRATTKLRQEIGEEQLAEMRIAAEARIMQLQKELDQLNAVLTVDVTDIPEPKIPKQSIGEMEGPENCLFDSSDPWVDSTLKQKKRKDEYRDENDPN